MAYFDSDRLKWPESGDINAWADFFETICMFSDGDRLSLEDFIDFLKDDTAKTSQQILTALNFNEAFLGSPLSITIFPSTSSSPLIVTGDEPETEEGEEDDFGGDDVENEEREDMRSRLLKLFSFIQSRKVYFGAYYPFEIDGGTHLRLMPGQTRMQSLYVVLLLSSEMQLYAPGDRNRIGHMFEALCGIPFSKLLPEIAEKRFFGAGGGTLIQSDYSGNMRARLIALAADLNIRTTAVVDDPDELGRSGDAGLDWVGWIPFEDPCDHQPVYFGQCACGANWINKQHETSLSIWRNFFDLNQSVQCFHFMPRSFRRNSLNWFRRSNIVGDLTLIDRYRLLKVFSPLTDTEKDTILNIYVSILREAQTFEYET